MELLERFYGLIVSVHIASATVFTMTLVIMQSSVGPALARIPASPEKEKAVAFMHGRWHPVVDGAIILLGFTGILLMGLRLWVIGKDPVLHLKTSFGAVALICAGLLHFYYRGKKRRLKAAQDTEKLQKVNRLTNILEKVALVCALIAWASGLGWNHSPF